MTTIYESNKANYILAQRESMRVVVEWHETNGGIFYDVEGASYFYLRELLDQMSDQELPANVAAAWLDVHGKFEQKSDDCIVCFRSRETSVEMLEPVVTRVTADEQVSMFDLIDAFETRFGTTFDDDSGGARHTGEGLAFTNATGHRFIRGDAFLAMLKEDHPEAYTTLSPYFKNLHDPIVCDE